MAIEKSEFKMAVAHELGAGFDDALEKADIDTHKWVGAKTALADAAKSIETLLTHISQDVKEEAMTIESSNEAQKYVRRAIELCRNLKLNAEVREQRAHGRAEAMRTVVKITKSLYDREQAKISALQAHREAELQKERDGMPEVEGVVPRRPPPRPAGARPANAIGALKRAEKAD